MRRTCTHPVVPAHTVDPVQAWSGANGHERSVLDRRLLWQRSFRD
jgi:hypothetical protein